MTILLTCMRRLFAALGLAALLLYVAAIVNLVRTHGTLSAIVLAAVLLTLPLVVARAAGLRLSREAGPQDAAEPPAPPLLGIELRIPSHQCDAYPDVIATLVGAGARVVAVAPEESGPAGRLVIRSEERPAGVDSVFANIATNAPAAEPRLTSRPPTPR